VSIAGVNIGLATALAGALGVLAPWHRCVAAWCYLANLAWMALWLVIVGGPPKELVGPLIIPLGLVIGQVAFHPGVPGAAALRGWAARALVLAMVASCLLALAQFTIGKGGGGPWRIDPQGLRFYNSSGFFSIQLTQGVVAGMVCLLVGGLAAGQPGWWRRTGQVAGAAAVAICGARAALLGFSCGIAGILAARGRWWLLAAVAAGLCLLATSLGVVALTQPQRFDDLLAMRDGRWPIWRTTVAVIAEHPLLGTGSGSGFRAAFREAYPRVAPGVPQEFPDGAPHAHNTPLALAAEHGIPGALLWAAMLVAALAGLRRAPPVVWRAGLGMAIVALVFGQFEKLDGESSRVLWTGLGILLALRHGGAAAGAPPAPEGTGARR
jgi:O-antigen ligase